MELNNKTVYLAGPLNHDDGLGYEWREIIGKEIKKLGGKIKDPSEFEPKIDGAEKCVEMDKQMIEKADIILVNFTEAHDNLSIGTPMEMMYAYQFDKPVITIGAEDHIWVQYHSDEIFSSVKEFIKYISSS